MFARASACKSVDLSAYELMVLAKVRCSGALSADNDLPTSFLLPSSGGAGGGGGGGEGWNNYVLVRVASRCATHDQQAPADAEKDTRINRKDAICETSTYALRRLIYKVKIAGEYSDACLPRWIPHENLIFFLSWPRARKCSGSISRKGNDRADSRYRQPQGTCRLLRIEWNYTIRRSNFPYDILRLSVYTLCAALSLRGFRIAYVISNAKKKTKSFLLDSVVWIHVWHTPRNTPTLM